MGDPWKSISPEGVRAFTYGVLTSTTCLVMDGRLPFDN
jgi:hypothetical protein